MLLNFPLIDNLEHCYIGYSLKINWHFCLKIVKDAIYFTEKAIISLEKLICQPLKCYKARKITKLNHSLPPLLIVSPCIWIISVVTLHFADNCCPLWKRSTTKLNISQHHNTSHIQQCTENLSNPQSFSFSVVVYGSQKQVPRHWDSTTIRFEWTLSHPFMTNRSHGVSDWTYFVTFKKPMKYFYDTDML